MRAINTKIGWIATASCLLAITSVAQAEEGVARISDVTNQSGITQAGSSLLTPEQLEQRAAYIRIRSQLSGHSAAPPAGQFQQVGYHKQTMGMMHSSGNASQGCGTGACGGHPCASSPYTGCNGSCQTGYCNGSSCNSCQSCNSCNSGKAKRGRKSNQCDSCYSDGYNDRMCTLFAKAPENTHGTNQPGAWWNAQTRNYQTRNQRLSNHLFGWLVPSGCGGQGCPPFGKYQVTYANDPGYTDGRDGQIYGAQGYGHHMSIPTAPNVRQSYNYSWGTPSSRITPFGQYAGPGPVTTGPHQSW